MSWQEAITEGSSDAGVGMMSSAGEDQAGSSARVDGDVASQVSELVCRIVEVTGPTDRPVESRLRIEADLGFTSLALAELAYALEDLFGLGVAVPEVVTSIHDVADIEQWVLVEVRAGRARLPDGAEVEEYLSRYDDQI